MLIFVTPTCERNASRLDFGAKLRKMVTDLQGFDSLVDALTRFDRVGDYFKMPVGRAFRVFARVIRVGSARTPVICLLDVYQQRSPTYADLVRNHKRLGPLHLDPLLDLEKVQQFVASQPTVVDDGPEPLETLPDSLRGWLQAPDVCTEMEVVYETDEWVNRIRNKKIDDYWDSYYRLLLKATSAGTGDTVPFHPAMRVVSQEQHSIVFARLRVEVPAPRDIIFLLAPLLGPLDNGELERLATLLPSGPLDEITLDDVATSAQRSYPAYILGSDKDWLAVERDIGSNLALSTEEEQVLFSCSRHSMGSDPPLPAFLNGRAGSGKSTMLLYLFSDYLDRVLRGQLQGDPLLITYSERLVDAARVGVGSLLSAHANYLANKSGTDKPRSESRSLDRYVQAFQPVLFSFLSPEERARFATAGYVDFNRFKRLYLRLGTREEEKDYLKLPVASRYSPELAWHVIRTFIKGRSLEITGPEDYETDVERRERTVSNATFRDIHDTIWDKWYRRLTEADLWDEQDLVRHILERRSWKPAFTAVFCDEAQDLTRLELRLVLRLSLFSQHDLTGEGIPALPMCFAGDPFQTVNPTGFRWEALRNAFDEEIIGVIDPEKTTRLTVHFEKLDRNYRSTPEVSKATNLIQLWRHVIFNHADLRPQLAWRKGKFPKPLRFVLSDKKAEEEFRKHAGNTIFLVPCENGQEADFISRDPVLREMFKMERGVAPGNVYSAAASKGLEFDRVIVYGFGTALDGSPFDVNPEADSSYEAAHFLNKLYVSASRARKFLFIVDTPLGEERIWRHAQDDRAIEPMLSRTRQPDLWRNLVDPIALGTTEDMQILAESDFGTLAETFESAGIQQGNPTLMDSASQYFELAGDRQRARRCDAWALRFRGKYQQAGEKMLNLGGIDLAQECFWDGHCWKQLDKWYKEHRPQPIPEADAVLATFMAQDSLQPREVEAFGKKLTKFLLDARAGRIYVEQWQVGTTEFANRVGRIPEGAISRASWGQLARYLEDISALAVVGNHNELAAECWYRAGTIENAVRLWERGSKTEDRRYLLAKADLEGVPAGLPFLVKAEAWTKIVEEWTKAGTPRGKEFRDWVEPVATALFKLGRAADACRLRLSIDDTDMAFEIFRNASSPSPPPAFDGGLFAELRDQLVRRQRWNDALFVVEGPLEGSKVEASRRRSLRIELIRELAYFEGRSPQLDIARWQDMVESVAKQPRTAAKDGLSFRELGAVYEKAGLLSAAAALYFRATSGGAGQDVAWARERWIAVRRRQMDPSLTAGRQTLGVDAERVNTPSDVVERAAEWGLSFDNVPEQPVLKRLRPKAIRVTGATPEPLREIDLSIPFEHLKITTTREKQRILIADTTEGRAVTVDFAKMAAGGDVEDRSDKVASDHRAFRDVESRYEAEFFVVDDEMTLEIAVGKKRMRIAIPK